MEKYPLLNKINSPRDLRRMPAEQMPALAREIRGFLVENVTKTGGHLASNLGVVELSIALHRVFDTPHDHIIFDVGHQSYVHKLLTGRRGEFAELRKAGGLSGFTSRRESAHDAFGAGHSSTAISAAVGFAEGDRISGSDAFSVAVVGDGAFTGGMVHEALNNCRPDLKLIVILNENEMSISKNTGAFAEHIAKLRTSKGYINTKSRTGNIVSKIPLVGEAVYGAMRDTKKFFKNMIFSSNYFEEMGLFYIGPVNGNDYEMMERALRAAKNKGESVILHVKTVKGKGYEPAEKNPREYHGILPAGEKSVRNFSREMGDWLVGAAKKDTRICAISASMTHSTGLSPFFAEHAERAFDVGIAEQHAVTFAAGLAAQGKKPYFAVYSSFLQRAYDSIIHDVALQDLGVVFCIDRAGIAASDGPTHHGILDVAFLLQAKNIRIFAPVTFESLREVLEITRLCDGPCAVRYPNSAELDIGALKRVPETLISTDIPDNAQAVIFTYGTALREAQGAQAALAEEGISAGVILLEELTDTDSIINCAIIPESARAVLFVEEGVRSGGAGMMIFDRLARAEALDGKKTSIIAIDDPFVRGKKGESIKKTAGISADDIISEVKRLLSR
ncbi:MAG: 1-deoxy-D-xylulose-5-phosphate synthase [Clostridia bacterium]|nr:1-deoxy-D-xylulose-5-phosphate synthase [Clostridia bacterium]